MKKTVNTRIILGILITFISLNLIAAFECPLSDGFFSDPEDPGYFYHCIGNRAFHFSCSDDLVFDAELKQCQWPTAGITRKPTTTTTTEAPAPTDPPITRVRFTETTTVANMNTDSSSAATVSVSPTPQLSTTEVSTRGRHTTTEQL